MSLAPNNAPTALSDPPAPGGNEPDRWHSLDALRAVALLLGVVLHAALAYVPALDIGWAIQDRNNHWLAGALVFTIHTFRLEVFFLLAGFFARLLHQRRGMGGFALNRMARVLVPFVAGWFLVFPGLAFAWTWGGMKGDPAALGVAFKIGTGAVLPPVKALMHSNPWTAGFPLTHLWFLYYLLLLYVAFFLLRGVFLWIARYASAWPRWADAIVRGLFTTRWTVVILGVVTWGALLQMRTWSVDTPDRSFRPHVPALLVFGLCFSVGWCLHRQSELLETLRRRWLGHLLAALLLNLPVLLLTQFEGRKAYAHYHLLHGIFCLAFAITMWSWILGLLGAFLQFRRQRSGFWRYLSDSSYWVYIIHLPVAVALQVALSRWDASWLAKLAAVSAGTLVFSLATYHLLVRPTPIGLLLNGRRHPLWPRHRDPPSA